MTARRERDENEAHAAINYFSYLLQSGCYVGEVCRTRVPVLAGLAGATEREGTDCVHSHDLFCPSFWDQIDNVFLEGSTQRRELQGQGKGISKNQWEEA